MPNTHASHRGLQFSDAASSELIETLAQTRIRMRLVDGLLRSSSVQPLAEGELPMTREQLTHLRRDMVALQSDLRAELRRRREL
jgi:hypothetical protein